MRPVLTPIHEASAKLDRFVPGLHWESAVRTLIDEAQAALALVGYLFRARGGEPLVGEAQQCLPGGAEVSEDFTSRAAETVWPEFAEPPARGPARRGDYRRRQRSSRRR